MSALVTGAVAPQFTLPSVGGGQFSLQDALKHGPVVVAFFKISCPVCQFAFPFVERLYQTYMEKHVTILGISQNDESATRSFIKEYGITFPVLLDDRSRYPVSNAYGLTNVPTIFFITQGGGVVEQTIIGWDRKEMDVLNRRLAELAGPAPGALFRPGEQVAEFKAG